MTTDAVGGVWTYARDLAAGLAERGLEVTLAVLGPKPDDAQRRDVDALGAVRLVEPDCPLDWLDDATERLERGGRALVELAVETRADLVHLNAPVFAAAGFAAPVVGACHSCLPSWWEATRGGGPPPASFERARERLRRGYLACDALIAPSRAFAAATERLYGVRPTVLPNGRSRRSASAGVKRRFVLTSGRLWDEAKNIAALDAAASLMRSPVEAAGPLEGPAGERIPLHSVASLGRLDAASLTRRLDEAAVYASLALYEPFGLGALEAAQAACALVLSDIPSHREIWDGAAIFVDPADPTAVAHTLDALLDDPRERGRRGALASVCAASFPAAAMVARTLALYREVHARRATSRGEAA